MNALEILKLNKRFGEHRVIDNLNLTVPQHSVFGFLGQNGAGKTTTMKMILGLLKADSGSIQVFGENVLYGQTKTNKYIGYLPDVPEFYNYMKPMEYLKLCGEITGMDRNTIKSRSHELLELVGIKGNNKRIGGFSRGMKQRLGIAQALINEPKLLICDEPTSALDPVGRKEILDILEQIKGKTTVLFSTHILSDVERICDRIAIINSGKVVLSGEINEIKEKHRTNSLFVEFRTKDELNKFLKIVENPLLKNLLKKTEINNLNTIFCVSDIKRAGGIILEHINNNSLLPIKFEVLEPTLENLFMEVTK